MIGDYITILLIISAIVGMWRYFVLFERRKQLVGILQMYQHICAPILVRSICPGDDTVHQRAEEWRQKLQLSGNTWYASGVIKVIEMPYNAYMSSGTLYGYQWHEYQLACNAEEHRLIVQFQKEHAPQVDPLLVNYRLNGQIQN